MLRKSAIALAVAASAAALTSLPAQAAKPVVTGHETVSHGMLVRGAHASKPARPTRSSNLTYHGGAVQSTIPVVIVYWGTQWGSNAETALPDSAHDKAGLAPLQKSFFSSVGNNDWVNSTRQYCGGPATNACNGGSSATWSATNLVFATWLDNTNGAAPSRPTQSQLAAEAVRAAQHFSNNLNVQYIIDTASGNSSSGFGTQYCAWHSSTSYSAGQVAYTNMPYVPDAGSSCGAGFVKQGVANVTSATQGVTIVGGHEWAETITDEYPNGGWLDSSGAENGDKCAWISSGSGASHVITTSAGDFAVQTLWSNANNGCV